MPPFLSFVDVLSEFGFNAPSPQLPRIMASQEETNWFIKQTLSVQTAIVERFCWVGFNTDIQEALEMLLSYSQHGINSSISAKLSHCYEVAVLAQVDFCAARRNWFYSQNITVQLYTIEKICFDWRDYHDSSTVKNVYALLNTLSPQPLAPLLLETMYSCAPLHHYDKILETHVYLFAAFVTVTLLMMISFLVFNLYYVTPRPKWSYKTLCTPFNISFFAGLLVLSLSNLVSIFALLAIQQTILTDPMYTFPEISANTSAHFATITVLDVLWSLSYLYFSYKRSQTQIRRVFPDSHKLFKWILSISPMIIASPIPLAIMNAITPHSNFGQVNRTFLASSNCMLVMMDLVLLYVFARFLGMMRSVAGSSSSGLAESKFNTICVFGSVAVSLCAVQSAGAVWFATMQWDVVAEYEYVLGWTSCFMGVRVLVMLVMLGMKWGLFRGAVEEVKLKVRGKEVELKFKSGVFSRATPSALDVKQSVMEQSEMNKSAFAEKSAGAISKMERTDTESRKSRMERGETFTFKENAILEIQEIMKAGNNDTIHRSLKHEVVENTGDTEDKDTDIAWKIFQDYLKDE